MKPPKRKSAAFDPSWVPEYRGNLLDWFDNVVEVSGIHPAAAAKSMKVLAAAGIDNLVPVAVVQEAARYTLRTALAWAARHNRRLAAGKATGFAVVKMDEWIAFAETYHLPEQEDRPWQENDGGGGATRPATSPSPPKKKSAKCGAKRPTETPRKSTSAKPTASAKSAGPGGRTSRPAAPGATGKRKSSGR